MGSRDVSDESGFHAAGEGSFEHTLASARTGDGAAFAELYESLNRRVRSFVSLRGAADPDGMVNDVFLKVFNHLGGFRGGEAQFRAWVFRIARNTLIDEARARRRRVDEVALAEAHDAVAPGGDVEDEALGRLDDEWLADQLRVLTVEQREVLMLRIVGDLTIESIADVLGKQVGAVKAMQRRAVRALAKNFERQAVPR